MIKRYMAPTVIEHESGAWVMYTDHERDLSALQRRVEEMEAEAKRQRAYADFFSNAAIEGMDDLEDSTVSEIIAQNRVKELEDGIRALIDACPACEGTSDECGACVQLRKLLEGKQS